MDDKYLNLFFSYNQDNELIEDNLTRAFILSLSLLSPSSLQVILSKLLTDPYKSNSTQQNPFEIDFSNAKFALQGNIDEYIPLRAAQKILLSISTEKLKD
ncbi:unnamed protein product, partial [marine sediment metagenome]